MNASETTRFLDKLDDDGGSHDDCWHWLGSKCSKGYGRFWLDGRWVRAHRVAYELLVGPIPPGLVLDHLCRQRDCCRPSHLEPCSILENIRRGQAGEHQRRKIHCPQGHRYDGENLLVFRRRSGRRAGRTERICLTCKRARARVSSRRYHARLRTLLDQGGSQAGHQGRGAA